MDDRELLELAARAAEIETLWDETLSRLYIIDGEHIQGEFRPLTEDGDRYRLARTLGINLDFNECYAWKRLQSGDLIQEFWGGDTGVDEAHAIVRAAAAIGQEIER